MLHEKRVYAGHESGTERKTINSFVLVRGGNDEEEEVWVRKVLSLFYCHVGKDIDGDGMAFVQLME